MKIAIHGKPFEKKYAWLIEGLFKAIDTGKVEIHLSNKFARQLKHHDILPEHFNEFELTDSAQQMDVFITLGGDGTILEAISHIGDKEIPILGINTGRLGFLADMSSDHLTYAINALMDKKFTIDKRIMLRLKTDKDLFNGRNYALNDFTILKKDSFSMIVVHAFIDGEFLNSYWSDGIIVATPTGSTGYSLSCGGPIILPNSNNFIITPVSPHTLTARPLVVASDSVISFKFEGRQKNFLISLDARYRTVDANTELVIRKERFCTNLVRVEGNSYFNTLRQKLHWGLDVRN